MTTIRDVATQGEIDFLVENDLILPSHVDQDADSVREEEGATFLNLDGLIVAIYPAVAPNAWWDEE